MYNKRANSKKKNDSTNNAVIYSAALQDHFMKKLNFNLEQPKLSVFKAHSKQPQKLPSISKPQAKPTPSSILSTKTQLQIQSLSLKQQSSILPYESLSLKKLKQQKNDNQLLQKYNKKLTWAQKLGIVQKPPLPLTAKDWSVIETKSKSRGDSQNICSICLQNFKIQKQVILSCSHVFHQVCLESFQRHNKVHCCPICRREGYEKKVIDQAIRLWTMKCIIRVQRVYRGSRDRIRLYGRLVDQGYVAKSKLFNRRLIGYKMWRLSSKIQDKIKRDMEEFSKMMKNIQKQHQRETQAILEQMVAIQRQKIINEGAIEDYLNRIGIKRDEKPKPIQIGSTVNWEDVMKKGSQRAEEDEQCSICLMALWSKPVYLFSCTHTFHVNCVQGFQRYSLPGCKNKCPCCRSQYQKRVVAKQK